MIDTITLQAGKYLIGDLCFVRELRGGCGVGRQLGCQERVQGRGESRLRSGGGVAG